MKPNVIKSGEEKEVFDLLESFVATLNPMLVMFTCIVIGYVLRKSGLAPENTGTALSKVENYVFMPSQVAVTFMTYCTVESLSVNYRYTLFSIVCLVVSMLMGVPLSNLFSKDGTNRGVYRYALVFANFGFLGNAVVPQILGQEFLYPYLLFTLPVNCWAYAWGVGQMVPAEGKTNPLKRLLNPVIIGLSVGAFLGLTGIAKWIPPFATQTLNSLSACMGPVAMILTGFIIGGYDLKELVRDRKVYWMTLLRLVILPAVLLAVVYLLGADLPVMTMVLIAFGAGLGLNSVVIPAAYGGDTKPGAAMAVISHVAAVISIPLMYAILTVLVKG